MASDADARGPKRRQGLDGMCVAHHAGARRGARRHRASHAGLLGCSGRGLICSGAVIWPVLLRGPRRGCDPACCSSLPLTGACVFFVVFITVQLADYSEGSMGPDIHPYPEGSEDALMVCTHIAGQVFCENGRVGGWGYGQDPAVMQEHARAGNVYNGTRV